MADIPPPTPVSEEPSVSFVSEWFGYRVYPLVADNAAALETQASKLCPFLTQITGDRTVCIKTAAASGICTISSRSNGPRQDWLVCPFRAFNPSILVTAARYLFPGRLGPDPLILPAPTLRKDEVRAAIRAKLIAGEKCVVYLQNKLGGEISLSRTERSPELSFDVTMVELTLVNDQAAVDAFGILELQTMDFHGSYRAVVKNLEDALRLHTAGFHKTLQQNQPWLRQGIEGPNIANVFKRTFYQMMLNRGSYNGRRLLSPASVEVMTMVQTGELKAGWVAGTGFGLTWEVTKDPIGQLTFLSPGTFHHGGAFGTFGWVDPKKGMVGIFLIQWSGNRQDVRDAFIEMTGAAALP